MLMKLYYIKMVTVFELGIVKEVLEREVPDFPSDAEQTIVCEYRVWFHNGDTTALTS